MKQESSINLELLKYQTTGICYNINSWGSCQYAGAYSMYVTLITLEGKVSNVFKNLGIEIIYGNKNPSYMIRFIEQIIKTYEGDKVIKADMSTLRDLEDAFKFCRRMGWDLWTTAPLILECIYPCIEIKGLARNIYSLDKGYDNNKVGICCYILIRNGYVKDESVFKYFDT